MIDRIKIFMSYVRKINPSLLSASITFYLLFLILPLSSLIYNLVGLFNISNFEYNNNLLSVIILFGSVIWISIKFFYSLKVSTNIIYQKERNKIKIRNLLKLVLNIVLLIFLIIIEIISSLFLIYFLEYVIGVKQYIILIVLEFILQFISIILLTTLIYKLFIPVKIKFRRTVLLGLVVTMIWYILIFIYRNIINYFIFSSYNRLYGSLSSLFLTILFIYLIVNVYIYTLVIYYYIDNYYHVNKNI